MRERLHRWLSATMSWRWVVPGVASCVACLAAFEWRKCVLPGDAPDQRRCGYTPAELAEYLGGIGELRWLYALSEVTLDLLFPVIYGAVLGWLVVWLYGRPNAILLLGFLVLGVVADWAENVTLACLTWTFDPDAQGPAWAAFARLASFLTLMKWIGLSAVTLAVLGGLIGKGYAVLFRRSPPS